MRTAQFWTLLDSCTISIEAAESKHPNEMKFSGVLVRVDEPSTKAPNGSRGHRILIPHSLAKKQLHTLIGMGVNYSSDLKTHAPTRKVGVIQKAWLDGKDLKISGIIWKKDFPDAVDDLSAKNLGMSFEASEISVEDENADIWVLKTLCFTGATILFKSSAAYYKTSADAMAASAEPLSPARLIKLERRRKFMAKSNEKNRPGKKKKISAGATDPNEALTQAFTTALAPVLSELKLNNKKLDTMQASIESLEANEEDDDENEDDDINAEEGGEMDESMTSKKVKAGRKKKGEEDDEDDDDDDDEDDEDDDIDSEADDEDELDDLGEDDDDETDEKVGKMNKDARENKGRTVPSKKAGKPMSSSADQRIIARLTASNEQLAEKVTELQRSIKRTKKQLSAAADRTDRKTITVSAMLARTMAKGNIDLQAMSDADEKLTIAEFDIAAAANNLDSVTSIGMKNELARMGLMELGEVKSRSIR